MRVIALRRLREFWTRHSDAESSLRSWYQVARQASWQRFLDVRAIYGHADQVGKFTVFHIAGNKYRMITVIHFNTGRVYVVSADFLSDGEIDRSSIGLAWEEIK